MIKKISSIIRKEGFSNASKRVANSVKWRTKNVFLLFCPPILIKLLNTIRHNKYDVSSDLPALPESFSSLPRSQQGLWKLIQDYDFDNVLDIGSGSGEHANVLAKNGKKVTALDFGTSIYAMSKESEQENVNSIEANFYETDFDEKFDCIWASHVLEHQPDAGLFLRRCMEITKEGGVIAITVPPLKHDIVGGHLSLWNAGLLLYQLVFNGLNCREASVCTYGYNITVIVKNLKREHVDITWDNGDVKLLKDYFPSFADEPFNGKIDKWNW